MTPLDSFVAQITDRALRQKIEAALAEMKKRQRFGLVFEEHIPETTTLFGLPVQDGSLVQRRDDLAAKTLYRVLDVTPRGRATITPVSGGNSETVSTRELLVVKRFGEPMYPALTPLGILRRGGPAKPHHAVINGENFHTLQLLVYLFERQVDCIYIDPPYNTGARDWKYNNHYVDKNDTWRHSKWLSFMEKRLRLAKRLLKPDGVLIVTIDENEVLHVGMLLESIFPEYIRYMVTAVINPKGTFKVNFGRVDEQLLFLVPNIGKDVITPRPALASEIDNADDVGDRLIRNLIGLGNYDVEALLNDDASPLDTEELDRLSAVMESDEELDVAEHETRGDTSEPAPPDYEDWFLRRRGQESSYRHQRPNQFYAILVDEDAKKVVGVGPPLGRDASYRARRDGDLVTVYPIDNEGHERVWRYSRPTMQRYIDAGEIVVAASTRPHEPGLSTTASSKKMFAVTRLCGGRSATTLACMEPMLSIDSSVIAACSHFRNQCTPSRMRWPRSFAADPRH